MNVPFETARDIIQDEPFPYDSMDRLRLMQRPGGLRSMGPRTVPMAHGGGLSDLPVVKAGFGGFLKKLAPIALAIAAPYVLPYLAPSVFGASATMFGGALASGTALGAGAMVGLGTGFGSLIAGAKPKDALKQALISGVTAGVMKGASNYFTGAGTAAGGTGNLAKTSNFIPTEGVSQAGTMAKVAQTPTNLAGGLSGSTRGVGLAYGAPNATTNMGQLATTGANYANVPVYNPAAPVEMGSNMQFTGGGTTSAPIAAVNNANALGNVGATVGNTVNPQDPLGKRIGQGLSNLRADIVDKPWSFATKAAAIDLGVPDFDLKYAQEDFDKLSDEDKAKQMYGENYQAYLPATNSFGTMERYRLPNRNPGGQLPKYAYRNVAQGGQVNRNLGGGLLGVATGSRFAGPQEFSGPVPGDGHGMEDNVYMPIVDRAQGQQVATLAVSPTEYVVDSHTMAALGNGNPNEGAKVMDQKIKEIRQQAYGTTKQPNQINGARSLESLTV
jgi:hypothetical protein|tara:strand:- start:2127 stop:3626 length:1500 start_codon:yes stop_codon:yes gene_type:complete